MKNMKRMLAFALMLIMLVALVGVTPAYAITEKKDVYTLTFYHIFAAEEAGGHESLWINKAIEEVKEKSEGRLIIDCGQQEGFHWYVETYHIASLNLLMINKSNLEKLPADLQEILISVFKEKSVEQCDDRVGVNEAELEKIKEAGVEVITPTEEAFAAFKAADTTFRDAKIAEWGDEAIFNEALEYVAANAK